MQANFHSFKQHLIRVAYSKSDGFFCGHSTRSVVMGLLQVHWCLLVQIGFIWWLSSRPIIRLGMAGHESPRQLLLGWVGGFVYCLQWFSRETGQKFHRGAKGSKGVIVCWQWRRWCDQADVFTGITRLAGGLRKEYNQVLHSTCFNWNKTRKGA